MRWQWIREGVLHMYATANPLSIKHVSCQQEATRDREIEADSIRKKDITLEDSPLYITAATQTEEMEVHLDITEEKVESISEKEVATAADDASLKTQVPLQIRSTAHAF